VQATPTGGYGRFPAIRGADRAYGRFGQRLYIVADRRGSIVAEERPSTSISPTSTTKLRPVLSLTEARGQQQTWSGSATKAVEQPLAGSSRAGVQACGPTRVNPYAAPPKADRGSRHQSAGQVEVDRGEGREPTSTSRASSRFADPLLDKLAKESRARMQREDPRI